MEQQLEALGGIAEATEGEAPTGERPAGQGSSQRFRTEGRLRTRLQLGEQFLEGKNCEIEVRFRKEVPNVALLNPGKLTTTELMQDMYS